MKRETYHKLWNLIIEYGGARFQKGVAPLGSDWEINSHMDSIRISDEIREILLKEIDR